MPGKKVYGKQEEKDLIDPIIFKGTLNTVDLNNGMINIYYPH